MPQLDFNFFSTQLFWLSVSFIFLFLIVNFFVIPVAEKIFTKREDYILSYIKEAKIINVQTDKLNKKIENHINETKLSAQEIINQAVISAEGHHKQKLKEVSEEIEKKKINSILEIESFKNSFKENCKDQVVQYSKDLISHLTNHIADINQLYDYYNKIKKE